jgi:hypothetical protein
VFGRFLGPSTPPLHRAALSRAAFISLLSSYQSLTNFEKLEPRGQWTAPVGWKDQKALPGARPDWHVAVLDCVHLKPRSPFPFRL